jgi:hypothetical protein
VYKDVHGDGREVTVRANAGFAILLAGLAAGLCACSASHDDEGQGPTSTRATEKAFVSGGRIDMQLEGGEYTIRPDDEQVIRVTLSGAIADVLTDLTADGSHAAIAVTHTPHSNFRAVVDVPKVADLTIHLTAGNLIIGDITGNKDIDSTAGNLQITVEDPGQYANVDLSVKAGDIQGGAFGGSRSGLFPHLTWSGPGTHTLHAKLGAGDLTVRGR